MDYLYRETQEKIKLMKLIRTTLFVLRPTTGQVRHKAFFKVGPD